MGLIGPNGAGKSTTFNLITGVLPATRGKVRFLGERLDILPSREIARLGVGRTFQHVRSEEHTSELQSLMRISYAVFCLKKKKTTLLHTHTTQLNSTIQVNE